MARRPAACEPLREPGAGAGSGAGLLCPERVLSAPDVRCSLAGFCRCFGSFRMEGETSGFGAISATSTKSSRLVLWVARAKSFSQFVSVRWGASTAMPLK